MLQSGQNVSVRIKYQSALGSPESGAGAEELPLIPSAGLRLTKTPIESPEVRSDGMTTLPRHGTRSVSGELGGVVRVGAHDTWLEALMRGTWVAAATITEADMTSITTGTDTIAAQAGSWLTEGVREGDIVTLTEHSTAANNDKRLLVLGVTASTITVPANSLTTNASPDSDFTLTVHRKLVNGITERYATIEEYHADIDQSELGTDCKMSSARIQTQADGTVTITYGVVGRDLSAQATGDSPVFTDPTQYDGANLVATDAEVYYDGVAITTMTGLDLTIDLRASTAGVVGAATSPDVFSSNARVSGTISAFREDLSFLEDYIAESFPSLTIVLYEPESAPKDFLAIHVPYITLTESPSAPLGGDGPMISSFSFAAGKAPAATGADETMVKFSTSAA